MPSCPHVGAAGCTELRCPIVIVPAARGLSVSRSVGWMATTSTRGIAAVAAVGCGPLRRRRSHRGGRGANAARCGRGSGASTADAEEVAEPTGIEVSLTPTPPEASYEDFPHFLALEPQGFAETDVHKLRIALQPRSAGVIGVAVEDDAG